MNSENMFPEMGKIDNVDRIIFSDPSIHITIDKADLIRREAMIVRAEGLRIEKEQTLFWEKL